MGIESIELLLRAEDSERREMNSVEMMESIASMATSMSATRLAMDVNASVQKQAMEITELAAQEMLQMMPPQIPLGQYIDTYA